MAASLAVEEMMGHFNVTAPEGYADLTDIATYAAKKAAIGSAVNVVAGQQKLKEAIKGAGVNFAAAVIGRYGAQEIGRAYGGLDEQGNVDPTKTKIGFVEHKLLHAGLGAIVGGIQGDPLAGAIGGAVAETVADTFKESEQVIIARVNEKAAAQGIVPGSKAYDNLVKAEVKSLMDWSKIAAVTVTTLADHDIHIALDTATNALENNFLPLLIVGVTAAGVAMAAYEVTQVYKEQGIEAAAKQLGIEIIVGAAGAVTGATAGRLAGKVVYRYGGRVYHSLSEAVDVVFKANPGLKLALGRFADQIKETAVRLGNTKAGQLYHRANQSAENLVNRVGDKVEQLVGRNQKQGTNILTGKEELKGKEVVGKKQKVSEETVETAPSSSSQAAQQLDPVTRFEQTHGKKAVQNMTDEEFIQRIANGSNKISAQKGPVVGTRKHKDAEVKLQRYQKMTGQRTHLEAEKRFKGGERWEQGMGTKGTSKVDVYNATTGKGYDYKFGDAKMSAKQEQKYQQNLPTMPDGSAPNVAVVKPTK